jgi:CHAT domain-containing protein
LLALEVEELRESVQKAAEDGNVSAEARERLQRAIYISGPTEKILQKLRQDGKWHLCIVPYGPLHFFPFHLLPYDGGLLGDQWAVTCLPARGLLEPRAARPQARSVEIASFGIDFVGGVPHGLGTIEGAAQEARIVATMFGEQEKVGAAATESALEEALLQAKRIHISTHGLLTVSAPSFQRLFLTPDKGDDGILYAWELLQHDLAGLDLLTLSACETALGRIDKGDNLRGFPANALIAGASTVIGTLWPVHSVVTQVFFETLYREIKNGSAKREAFQTAQLTARQNFPEYRDWGAFWYMGLW